MGNRENEIIVLTWLFEVFEKGILSIEVEILSLRDENNFAGRLKGLLGKEFFYLTNSIDGIIL
jgi:hypothetical protein